MYTSKGVFFLLQIQQAKVNHDSKVSCALIFEVLL